MKNRFTSLFLSAFFLSAFWSCTIKPLGLYNNSSLNDTIYHIENVYALNIFKDYLSSEIWYTENSSCLQVENIFDNSMIGSGGLYVKWNKTSGGCNWIGMGIGWDGWTPKNLQEIYQDASIQFMVRSPKGTQKGLPWAMAFEDYSGGQAWAGVFSNFIEGQQITERWTKVQVPLSAFDFSQFDADLTSIKHLIIQFESEGEIYLDEIQIVSSNTSSSKIKNIPITESQPIIDCNFDQALYTMEPFILNDANVWMSIYENTICLFAIVKDQTPMQNKEKGKNIWNGDAIEIAFSTNADAKPNRKSLLLSDQHIGISATENPIIWDFKMNKPAQGKAVTRKIEEGYLFECSIPIDQFISASFEVNETYLLELAIDAGTQEKGRETQYRWNNIYNDGFYNSPQLWGKMVVTNEKIIK